MYGVQPASTNLEPSGLKQPPYPQEMRGSPQPPRASPQPLGGSPTTPIHVKPECSPLLLQTLQPEGPPQTYVQKPHNPQQPSYPQQPPYQQQPPYPQQPNNAQGPNYLQQPNNTQVPNDPQQPPNPQQPSYPQQPPYQQQPPYPQQPNNAQGPNYPQQSPYPQQLNNTQVPNDPQLPPYLHQPSNPPQTSYPQQPPYPQQLNNAQVPNYSQQPPYPHQPNNTQAPNYPQQPPYPHQPNNTQVHDPQQPSYPQQPTNAHIPNYSQQLPYPQQPNNPSQTPYPQQPPGLLPHGTNQSIYSFTSNNTSDLENGGESPEGFQFSNKSIRLGFIRKVYSILVCQIAITTAIIGLFTYHDDTKNFVIAHTSWIMWPAGITFFIMLIILCCCDVHRLSPANYICLGIFTLAVAFMVACFTVEFDKEDVLLAATMTELVTIALTLFAFQTKTSFTTLKATLFMISITLLVSVLGHVFLPHKSGTILIAFFGVILYAYYLIYDTQVIMGKDHTISISPEEYVLASLVLYIDIILLFIRILILLSKIKKDSKKENRN